MGATGPRASRPLGGSLREFPEVVPLRVGEVRLDGF